jgi:hypothetical protein
MIVVERPIAGVVRYRKVYLPSEAQLTELVENLRPFDLLRAFWPAAVVSRDIRPVVQSEAKTTFVDLSKGPEAIYARMHRTCRYKVRRAEKMRDHFEIAMNSEAARTDFLPFYNDFARKKGNIPLLTPHQLNEYLPYADIFMLYFEGQPTCGRLVLRDDESGTAVMLYSGTCRLEEGADTITIGLLNRYLYWHEMKTYQAAGLAKYDFGGASDSYPSVTHFKLSFGGELTTLKYCFYAGTARFVWKVAHSLNQFQHDWRFNIKHLAA